MCELLVTFLPSTREELALSRTHSGWNPEFAVQNLVSQNETHRSIVWCSAYTDGPVVNHLGVTQERDRHADVFNNTAWTKPDEHQSMRNTAQHDNAVGDK